MAEGIPVKKKTSTFVIGELACGNLKNKTAIIALLEVLPMAHEGGQEEVLALRTHKSMVETINDLSKKVWFYPSCRSLKSGVRHMKIPFGLDLGGQGPNLGGLGIQ